MRGLLAQRTACIQFALLAGVVAGAFLAAPAFAIVVDFAGLPAGHVLQSSDFPAGTTLTVTNNNPSHPQLAIVFDSACTIGTCSGGDDDLRTPGSGPGNTVPQGKIMIIAEDAVDVAPADGLVDDPDDEFAGGTIELTFSTPYKLLSVRGIDFEPNEPTHVEIDPVGGGPTQTVPFSRLGDNSAETLVFTNPPAALAIRFVLGGTGAFDELVLVEACGDGTLDPGEECDPPGSAAGGGVCSQTCTVVTPECGDGVVEGSEQCDPPFSAGGSADCKDDCTLAVCGDGVVEAGEQCDPPADQGGAATCNTDCTESVCGDGVVEAGEECDPPGSIVGNATCDTNCTLVSAVCGDGVIDVGEECDPPATAGGVANCNDDCRLSVCGDGAVEAGEQCDPPATQGGMPACNDDCTLSVCGDGVVGAGEECDPPAGAGGLTTCNADCTLAVCGDGEIEAGEQCDPPASQGGDPACDDSCQQSAVCGNGIIEPGEECDPPDGSTCDAGCQTIEACGNGVLDPGEQCDPPNPGEICDNGLDDDNDGDIDCLDTDCKDVPQPTCNAQCLETRCEGILRDPARIIVNEPGELGFLSIHGRVRIDPAAVDPVAMGFGIELRNEFGRIYRGDLQAGDLIARSSKRFRFVDKAAKRGEGARAGLWKVGVRLRKIRGVWHYVFRAKANADFSRATVPAMTTQIYVGPAVGTLSAEWKKTRKGWQLRQRDFSSP